MSLDNLESKALCEHEHLTKEVIMGQKTGDRVCTSCGECFMRNEKVVPLKYRNDYVSTTRELMIVLKFNPKAKIAFDYKSSRYSPTYPAAVISVGRTMITPVFRDIAQETIEAGYAELAD